MSACNAYVQANPGDTPCTSGQYQCGTVWVTGTSTCDPTQPNCGAATYVWNYLGEAGSVSNGGLGSNCVLETSWY
jgi:hypothetical protein